MGEFNIFQDIAQRTGGDIYIGVVGPVRTGKSTLIKKFVELMVLPQIADEFERERTLDELPQSGAGRTVMTTEPKFVPDEGMELTMGENLQLRVRLVDSVGFPIPGALGYSEDGNPRMVVTPWFDYEIPFEEAAEIGTRKVITDHSTIGLVVTADGSFGELPRENFAAAEQRAIEEIRDLGKPFIVLLNSSHPDEPTTQALADDLTRSYGVAVIPVNLAAVTVEGIEELLTEVLYEFPVRELNIDLPSWVNELDSQHWLRRQYDEAVGGVLQQVRKVRDVRPAVAGLTEHAFVAAAEIKRIDMGTGVADVQVTAPEELFYQVLEEITGVDLSDKAALIRAMREFTDAKTTYDKLADGLRMVKERGYGIVSPQMDDMRFDEPELVRRGNQFGVKLKASAPSFHIIRTDVEAEYTPILGTERQSEDLMNYLMEKFEDDPSKIWESNIFGKSLNDLLRAGILSKIEKMPEHAQGKVRETLQRIVNEGSGGLICIIL